MHRLGARFEKRCQFWTKLAISVVVSVVVSVLAPKPVTAHSPLFPEDNHGLATAYHIDDPAKSWATYTALDHSDKGDYYRFDISSGDKINISLITPDSPSESGFLPSFALLVPNSIKKDSVPLFVEVPSGYGIVVVNGTEPGQATYEAFTPGWYYELGSLTMNAPADGTYYIVVFNDEGRTGKYGLPVGYIEEFTPIEIVMVPFNVQQVYAWEGQNRLLTLLPILLVVTIGGVVCFWRNRQCKAPRGSSKWVAAFAGLMFSGTALSTIYQMLTAFTRTGATGEAALTLIFFLISLVLGIFALMYAIREKPLLTLWRRASLIAMGLLALFGWSGLYLGPALAILAALMPAYTARKK